MDIETTPAPRHLIVLTGPPGSGKTTLLEALRLLGVIGVDEPGRHVIAEQRSLGGRGTSEQDPALFVQLMLMRAIDDYGRHRDTSKPVLFDRGLPDLIAYANHFGIDPVPIRETCLAHRYNQTVLYLPAWAEIYVQDEERRMTFDAAKAFGDGIIQAYEEAGYRLVFVPLGSTKDRADFVLDTVRSIQ